MPDHFYRARLKGLIVEWGTIGSKAEFMKALRGFAQYLQDENLIEQQVLPDNVMSILERSGVPLTLHQTKSPASRKERPLDKPLPDHYPKQRKDPATPWPADFNYGQDIAVKAWLRRCCAAGDGRVAGAAAGVAVLAAATATACAAEALRQNPPTTADPDADALYADAVLPKRRRVDGILHQFAKGSFRPQSQIIHQPLAILQQHTRRTPPMAHSAQHLGFTSANRCALYPDCSCIKARHTSRCGDWKNKECWIYKGDCIMHTPSAKWGHVRCKPPSEFDRRYCRERLRGQGCRCDYAGEKHPCPFGSVCEVHKYDCIAWCAGAWAHTVCGHGVESTTTRHHSVGCSCPGCQQPGVLAQLAQARPFVPAERPFVTAEVAHSSSGPSEAEGQERPMVFKSRKELIASLEHEIEQRAARSSSV